MTATVHDARVSGAIVVLDGPEDSRPAAARRLLGALARIESRRIVLHPAFLLGLLGTVFTLWQQREGDIQQYWMLVGQASTTVGAMTFLLGFLNAARVRRDDAEELYAAFPATAGARTGGILLDRAVRRRRGRARLGEPGRLTSAGDGFPSLTGSLLETSP